MSKPRPSGDYGDLFEKVTGETELVDEQDESEADSEREIDDEIASYVDETARDDGLDEAVAEPDTA